MESICSILFYFILLSYYLFSIGLRFSSLPLKQNFCMCILLWSTYIQLNICDTKVLVKREK